MPKTKLHKTLSNQTSQVKEDDLFSDFEVTNTTDGSWLGKQKHIKAQQAHYEKKLQEEFEKVKARLKAAKTKVGLITDGNTIQLQASLPLKPGDEDKASKGTKQYKISLNIPFNPNGLKTAEEEAYELGRLIARKQFEWTDQYLGKLAQKLAEEAKPKTLGDLLPLFEEKYFETRKRTRKSERTYSTYVGNIGRLFNKTLVLSEKNIRDEILKIPVGSSDRVSAARGMSVFCSTFEIQVNFRGLANGYKPGKRNVPSKDEIIKNFDLYDLHSSKRSKGRRKDQQENCKFWQWCYGMIATFGLRPEELFIQPHVEHWLSESNVDNTWKVHKDTKTGERIVFPVFPDWIELFGLKDSRHVEKLKEITCGIGNNRIIRIVSANSEWFKKVGMPFVPYDLRHAFAINGHLLGISIKVMADNMGHSVEEHTKTYQRHFGEENRRIMIKQALTKKSEMELLKEKNEALELENKMLTKQNQDLMELVKSLQKRLDG